jgi:hypothetical protein
MSGARMMARVDADAGGVVWLTLRLPVKNGGAVESVSKIRDDEDFAQRRADAIEALIQFAHAYGGPA